MRFGAVAGLLAPRVGVDPGAANTLVYVRGRGVVVDEPSVVTVRTGTRRIEWIGREADAGRGRTPRRFETARPASVGSSERDLYDEMLRRFLQQARLPGAWRRYRAAVAVPARTTSAQRLALAEMIHSLGAADVDVIDQLVAAARGAGAAEGSLVVSIGAAVTEAARVDAGRVSGARWTPTAGDAMDAAIVEHVAQAHGIAIGERTAERLKIEIGSAAGEARGEDLQVTGRCLAGGIPRSAVIRSGEVREALAGPLARIAETIAGATPGTRIVLTGGSALLPGIADFVRARVCAPVTVASEPRSCVIRGIAARLAER